MFHCLWPPMFLIRSQITLVWLLSHSWYVFSLVAWNCFLFLLFSSFSMMCLCVVSFVFIPFGGILRFLDQGTAVYMIQFGNKYVRFMLHSTSPLVLRLHCMDLVNLLFHRFLTWYIWFFTFFSFCASVWMISMTCVQIHHFFFLCIQPAVYPIQWIFYISDIVSFNSRISIWFFKKIVSLFLLKFLLSSPIIPIFSYRLIYLP